MDRKLEKEFRHLLEEERGAPRSDYSQFEPKSSRIPEGVNPRAFQL